MKKLEELKSEVQNDVTKRIEENFKTVLSRVTDSKLQLNERIRFAKEDLAKVEALEKEVEGLYKENMDDTDVLKARQLVDNKLRNYDVRF